MTKERLKKAIRKKFGTFTKFAKLAGLNYYDLKKGFLDAQKVERQDLADMEALLNATDGPDEFTLALRKSLQEAINEYGGVLMFCMANARFTASTVFQILSQEKESYKRITPTIKRLLDHFNIKY
jgi:hypothetical protein